MKRLLIFTKNIMAEWELQKKMILLGYEVLCSQNLMELFANKQSNAFLPFFTGIIFSETISDEDILELLDSSWTLEGVKFRADAGEVPEEKRILLEEKGIEGWLDYDMSLKELREVLSQSFQHSAFNSRQSAVLTINKNTTNQVKQLLSSLSAKERKVFSILYDAQGACVSRKEILAQIWEEDTSHSNLTQLSQITQRIRHKMEKAGFDGKLLETQWKKGYALSDLFITEFTTSSYSQHSQEMLNVGE